MFRSNVHLTFDPYISYKGQRLASTASERESAKYHRKTGFFMINPTKRGCQGGWGQENHSVSKALAFLAFLRSKRLSTHWGCWGHHHEVISGRIMKYQVQFWHPSDLRLWRTGYVIYVKIDWWKSNAHCTRTCLHRKINKIIEPSTPQNYLQTHMMRRLLLRCLHGVLHHVLKSTNITTNNRTLYRPRQGGKD